MGHTISVRLDKELAEWLEETAAKTGVSQGQLVREQLSRAKAAKAGRPYMRLAGSIRGLPRTASRRRGFSGE